MLLLRLLLLLFVLLVVLLALLRLAEVLLLHCGFVTLLSLKQHVGNILQRALLLVLLLLLLLLLMLLLLIHIHWRQAALLSTWYQPLL